MCGGIVVSRQRISFCEAPPQLRRAGILENRAIASGARGAPVKGQGQVHCLYMEAPVDLFTGGSGCACGGRRGG